MKKKLVKIVSLLLVLCSVLTLAPVLTAEVEAAASWPSVSSSAYCEFKAAKNINVYRDTGLKTRGTSSPAKSYNAYIAKNDVCYIYKITSSYLQVSYPTSSGRRTGYVKRSDVFSVSAPTAVKNCYGKATTYVTPGGASYGNTASGDKLWACGTSGSYTAIIYTAKSGSRAYKFGWVTTAVYKKIIVKPAVSNKLLFPIKGSITRSSTCKTNGQYCDYKASSGTPIYAPADGTVQFQQTYAKNYGKLASYGNSIVFTSADKQYTVRCAHLSKFNNISLKYTKSLSYPCSASKYSCITITLATRTVKQGELIGYTGSTGNASGPHIHIEVKKNGTAVNPTTVFTTW